MFRPLAFALLLSGLTGTVSAQTLESPTPQEPVDSSASQQDIGTLQAELAKVEAERQRLADQLAATSDAGESEALTQLQEENQQLRNNNQAARMDAQARLIAQQQRWFLIGGLTVAASLLLGFMLAKMGRQKRREWLN